MNKPIRMNFGFPDTVEPCDRVYAELIHPYDVGEMLNKLTEPGSFVDVIKYGSRGSEFLEISGRLYVQTTRVPARTKDIK